MSRNSCTQAWPRLRGRLWETRRTGNRVTNLFRTQRTYLNEDYVMHLGKGGCAILRAYVALYTRSSLAPSAMQVGTAIAFPARACGLPTPPLCCSVASASCLEHADESMLVLYTCACMAPGSRLGVV